MSRKGLPGTLHCPDLLRTIEPSSLFPHEPSIRRKSRLVLVLLRTNDPPFLPLFTPHGCFNGSGRPKPRVKKQLIKILFSKSLL